MNDFWDNLGKAVNEAAYKAIKASGDAVELTKASLNIKFDEIKRESFFKEMGKIVYANYKANPESADAEVLDFCKCIDEIEASINEQKNKAAQIKNKKFCVDCGVQLEKSVSYCYACGAKQPIIVEENVEENIGENVGEDTKEDCVCCCETDKSEDEENCGSPEECENSSSEDKCDGDSCCL